MNNHEKAQQWLAGKWDRDTGEYYISENDHSLVELLDRVAAEARLQALEEAVRIIAAGSVFRLGEGELRLMIIDQLRRLAGREEK